MEEKVQAALDTVRPAIQADGGDVELLAVTNGVVLIKFLGACNGCHMSQMTMKMGIEQAIKKAVPEIERVEAVSMP